MKRRTFLRLSPAILALPLSLELSGCGGSNSTAPCEVESASDASSDWGSDTDFVEDSSFGIGLEEAQSHSALSSCPYFIHRSDGLFYPVLVTLESNFGSAAFSSYEQLTEYAECLTICLSDGDELVYISSRSIPDKVPLYCIERMGNTIPVTLIVNASYFDSKYVPRLESLKRYFPKDDPLDENRGFYYKNYWSFPFSQYDLSCNSDRGSLHSVAEHVSLNGSSLESISSAYVGSDKLLYSAGLTNHSGTFDVIEKEYLFCNYSDFPPENEIETELLYNLSQGSETVLEWYEGTEYNKCTLTPSYVYFNYNTSDSYSCSFTPTPNGYAVVSLNSLPSTNGSYILKCYEGHGDPQHVYLFIKP